MENKNIIEKTIFILSKEKTFFLISIAYGVAISILTLGVPISVQSLVNTVTFGVMLQPLLVICIALFLVLLFSSFFKGLQAYTIEMFQRHFYARTVTEITEKLVKADINEMRVKNGAEIVNRYFEIMTIQKKVTGLVTDFVSVVLQTFVGLILIALYHPYFLVFDFVLVILLFLVWVLFAKPSIKTAISESKAKYKVANWLQEAARLQNYFQTKEKISFVTSKSDALVKEYLNKRKKHFNFLFSQVIYLLVVYAVMSVGVLGLGGYLVVIGELSIGQLVAVELIITVILTSIAKSGKHFESIYDLFAGIDKLYAIYSIKNAHSLEHLSDFRIEKINFKNVKVVTVACSYNFDFEIKKGSNYFYNCSRNSGKDVFVDILYKYNKKYEGSVIVNNLSLSEVPKASMNENVYFLNSNRNFQGTLEENLKCFGHYDMSKINLALTEVGLQDRLNSFDNYLQTEILPTGYPLWPSELLRFEIAKIIISKPSFVIVGKEFRELDKERRTKIIKLFNEMDISLIYLYNERIDQDKKDINVGLS